MKPMLAKTFNPKKVKYPCAVQPKLNGLRALRLSPSLLFSRGRPKEEGKFWNPGVLPHIERELPAIRPTHRLDGELYCHGMSLQQINSRGAVNRIHPHDDHAKLTYHVFDVVQSKPFHERMKFLAELEDYITVANLLTIRVVETQIVNNEHELRLAYKLFRLEGYEGLMCRSLDAYYGLLQNCGNQENRWDCLMKLKDSLDVECELLSVQEGQGKYVGMCGSLELRTPDGVVFSSGGGLDDAQRQKLWDMRHELRGSLIPVRVVCDEMSDGGTPVRNRIESIDIFDL